MHLKAEFRRPRRRSLKTSSRKSTRLNLELLEDRTLPAITPLPIAIGADAGNDPRVRVLDPFTLVNKTILTPYASTFKGGVRVAVGDVNNDGVPDIITAPGVGLSNVRVFDGITFQPLAGTLGSFSPYGANFKSGIYVACADMDKDGYGDIITGSGNGIAKGDVRIISGRTGLELMQVQPFASSFRGGVAVAAADVTGDGRPELIVGSATAGSQVRVFKGDSPQQPMPGILGNFAAFPATNRWGVTVSGGDLDGDGKAEVVVGSGNGNKSLVRIFDGATGTLRREFSAAPLSKTNAQPIHVPDGKGILDISGVRVAVGDVNGDGKLDVIAGAGPRQQSYVRYFDGTTFAEIKNYFAFPVSYTGGIFPAATIMQGNDCNFDPNLTGWTFSETGGTTTGKATVAYSVGTAILREGDSYTASFSHNFTITSGDPNILKIQFDPVVFDTASTNRIRDAFEIAFLANDGTSLVQTIASGRDSFFNSTEGQSSQSAAGVSIDTNGLMTVNLAGLAPGTVGKLVFRLINNDADTNTQVTLKCVMQDKQAGLSPSSAVRVATVQTTPNPITIDPSTLTDVSASILGEYGRTSYFANNTILFTTLALRNAGSYGMSGPAIVVIDHLSDPTVIPQGVDGFLPDGRAYFNFTTFLSNGRLAPGAVSTIRPLQFFSPSGKPFTYSLTVLAQANRAPVFDSTALPDVAPGRTYVYPAHATDPDGDTVSYRLLSGPTGLTIDAVSGQVQWTPTLAQVGNHQVEIEASDGRGGLAQQLFNISVRTDIPNRPPVFTSTPVVDAYVNTRGPLTQVNLSNWTVQQYPLGQQGNANWVQSSDHLAVTQQNNADASILLSDFNVANEHIEGTWRGASSDGDDDFFGFVFGYQDSGHYYLFDWKQGSQTDNGLFAEKGMSVKVVNADTALTEADLWPTAGNGARVQSLYHNTVAWQKDTDYQFSLDFSQGQFTIEVKQGATVLSHIVLNDSTYNNGKFGFYNYSQGRITYSGFNRQTINGRPYTYDADAIDPDFDPVTYSLADSPAGMIIDPATGLIQWRPIANAGSEQVQRINRINLGAFYNTRIQDFNGGQAFNFPVGEQVLGGLPFYIAPVGNNAWSSDDRFQGGLNPKILDIPVNIYSATEVHTLINNFWGETQPGTFAYVEFIGTGGAYYRYDLDGNSDIRDYVQNPWTNTINGTSTINVFKVGSGQNNEVRLDKQRFVLPAAFAGQTLTNIRLVDNGGQVFQRVFLVGATVLSNEPLLGPHNVSVRAEDGRGGVALQNYVVTVRNPPENNPPLFVSEPPTGAVIGTTINYPAQAIDPDDDPLTYSLVSGPDGMTIDPSTGAVSWNTAGLMIGDYPVVLKTADGRGGEATQPFTIHLFAQGGTIKGRKFQGVQTGSVSSTGVIYLAGRDDVTIPPLGVNDPNFPIPRNGGTGPNRVQETFPTRFDTTGGQLFTFAATGGLDFYGGSNPTTADGYPSTNSNISSLGGISGYNGPNGSLVGVFLNDDNPGSATPPTRLDFSNAGLGTAFSSLSPGLGQVFFIGDGLTGLGNGTRQQFSAPAGATRLFLGIADGFAFNSVPGWYDDNLGNLTVTVNPDQGNNIAPGLAGFIVYLDQNNNKTRDPGELYKITDGQGNYEFDNLPPGQYYVREESQPIVGQTYLYSDGDFDPTQWDDQTVFLRDANPSLSGPSVIGPLLRTTGGNPGNYRYQGDDFRVGDLIATSSINKDAVYDPHLRGAVDSVDFSIDLLQLPPTLPGQGPGASTLTLALEQNGIVYYGTPFSSADTNWAHFNFSGIKAADFDTQIIPQEHTGIHPDFSANAAPITWGYGHLEGGGGSPGFRILNEFGIDNWQVTVHNVGQAGLWEQTYPTSHVSSQTTASYVDWTSADATTGLADGTVTLSDGSTVGVHFESLKADGSPGNFYFSQINGGTDYWVPTSTYTSTNLTNSPPNSELLALVGGENQTYRLTFTEPIVNPIMAIVSLGSGSVPTTYNFDAPFNILSQGPSYFGGSSTSLTSLPGNILRGAEGNGVIEFQGTYASFSWTVPTPELWHGFTFAIRTSEGLNQDGFYKVQLDAGETESGKDFGNRRRGDADPEFTSDPVTTATVNTLYRYNVESVALGGATYDLPQKPQGMVIDPVTGLIVWRPTDNQEGEQTVVVRARDSQGRVAVQSFTIDVKPANTAPAFVSEPTRQAVVNHPWQYRAKAIDAENDALTFSLDSGPAGMTITPNGIVNWTPTAGQLGNQSVQIKVSDGRGGEAIQVFTLNVVDNAPNTDPVISGTPRTIVRVGDNYLSQLFASDADGDPLTYSLPIAPNGMTIDSDGYLHFMPTSAQLGDQNVTVRVTDGQGGQAQTSFVLHVVGQETNHAPVITSTPPAAAVVGKTLRYNPTAIDADGDPLVWSLLSGPEGMAVDPGTGTLRWRPTLTQLGDQTVVLQATDPLLASTTQTFTLHVRGSNTPPLILSSPLTEAAINQPYEYRVRAQDAEGDTLIYALPIAPAGMMIDAATGIITWTPGAAQVGSFSVEVTASDGQGGVATQDYTVVVSGTALNRPPVITSAPLLKASVNRLYSYQVVANDPEGDPIVYALLSGPTGMSIDTATGLVTWTPTTAQFGTHLVTLGARDASGIFGQQTYRISVIDNQAPTITSTPVTLGTPGTLYRYDVGVNDPDGDTLTFSLTQFQPGMTIDSNGRITWQVPLATGTVPISVNVSDGRGGIATQNFNLTIAADTQAPQVTAQISPNPAFIGNDVLLQILATDNNRVASLVLTINGDVIPIAADGSAHFDAVAAGNFPVQIIATDPAGNQGVYTTNIVVNDETDPTGMGPDIVIASPAADATITSLINVVGSISSTSGVANWSVSIAPFGSTNFRQIATGTGAVSNANLATFDPTTLANDQYIIRVIARDSQNRSSRADVNVNVQGELKLGRFTQEFIDLSLPLAGIPIEIRRIYDTLDSSRSGDFGFGWHLAFADARIRETVAQNVGNGFFGPTAAPFKVGTKVYLTTPEGKRVGFTFDVDPVSVPLFGLYYRPKFIADPGVFEKLDVLTQPGNAYGDLYIKLADGTFAQPFALFGGRFNPDDYNLTLTDGTIYRYNQQNGLKEVVDPHGNKVTFGSDGVISSTGVGIQFQRDAQGRITQITDPNGKILKYSYDASGNLLSSSDQINNTTHYGYLSNPAHYLSQLTDPRGNIVLRMQYDAVTGRATGLLNADGNSVTTNINPMSGVETVRDAAGNLTSYRYDDRGNIVEITDANGGHTFKTYDLNNNLLSVTDPLGHTTRFAYDSRGNRISMTDALGNVTLSEYDTNNKLIRTTNALGQTQTYTNDSRGNVTKIVDAAGIVSTYEYDNSGRLTRQINAACCGGPAIDFQYDTSLNYPSKVIYADGSTQQIDLGSFGETLRFIDESGNILSFAYDDAGRLLRKVDQEGHITQYTYDANGNVVTVADPKNQQTRYTYDASNRVTSMTDPLGNMETYTYDANGNQISLLDRNGQKRVFQYDFANRKIAEDWIVGGNTVRYQTTTYDAAGNMATTSSPASTYQFTYDSANRLIQVDNQGTAAQPHVAISYLYDAIGNLTRTSDSSGVAVAASYDSRNLLTSYSWQGGGIDPARMDFSYDALRRKSLISRSNSLSGATSLSRTSFSYDTRGNFASITNRDATDSVFSKYDYSYLPNRLIQKETQIDRQVLYTYDRTGQVLSADWSTGQPDENYTYDANGNRTSSSIHGASYVIGTGDRLLSDNTFDYTYDRNGNLTRQTLRSTGEYYDYRYDYRNRQTSVTHRSSGGVILGETDYTYDALDRRIVVTTNGVGVSTVYNGQNTWADYESNGSVKARYLMGAKLDEVLARFIPGQGTSWYITDRLGTVRDLLNAQGQLLNHYTYDTFGRVLGVSNAAAVDRFQFQAREADSGNLLMYYRARFYDPQTGRFAANDPLGLRAGDTNLYRFVRNNPVIFLDPLGTTIVAQDPAVRTTSLKTALAQVETQRKIARVAYCNIQLAVNILIPTYAIGPNGTIQIILNTLAVAQYLYCLAGVDFDPFSLR